MFDTIQPWGAVLSDNDDEEDIDQRMAYEDQEKRLKKADHLTSLMTNEEYAYYSDCRKASFTFKKRLRFREWAELDRLSETKINIDVQDILGFLACEIVCSITEMSLDIKREWDLCKGEQTGALTSGLFRKPDDAQTPLQPTHIREAFRRMQKDQKYLRSFQVFNLLKQGRTQKEKVGANINLYPYDLFTLITSSFAGTCSFGLLD
jgi:transcription initiation protein SPT3